MVYINGSLTDANPGPALYALMAPALTTAGYTLVDTVTISTRTHKVWKSAAANNSQGLDWYLDVAYTTTGAGSMWLTPFEYFDPATDLGYRGPYANAASTVIETTYYTRYGATGSALETNWVGAGLSVLGMALSTSTFAYWMSITGSRVVAMSSTDPTTMFYGGLYQPDTLHATKVGAAIYPLVVAKCAYNFAALASVAKSGNAANTSTAALTRLPGCPTLSLSGWGYSVLVVLSGHYNLTGGTPWVSPSPALPNLSGSSLAAARPLWVYPDLYGGPQPALYGALIDVAWVPASSVTRGDTVTINAESWVLTGAGNGVSLLFKAV